MDTFRAIVRVILISLGTLFLYTLFLAGMLLLAFHRRRSGRWRNFIVKKWAKMVVCILGIRITVRGTPPTPPFFLVSNHLSYMDIVVYFTRISCVFIAKKEVSAWPVVGLLARSANTLFIDRRNHRDIQRVNELISKNINEDQGVILFAEGTSSKGETVKPFKPSLLEYPAEKNLPVSYASITYRTPPGTAPTCLSVCWWGDMTFGSHAFNLFKLPYIQAAIEFGKEPLQNNDRKLLAQELWEKVHGQFIPVPEFSHPANKINI